MADYQFSTVWRVRLLFRRYGMFFLIPISGLNGGEVWNALLRLKKVMYRALGRCIVIPGKERFPIA